MKPINFAFLKLHCLITLIIPIAKLLIRASLKHTCSWRDKFNAFALNAKSFAITVLVFFSFFPSRHFFRTDCQKVFSHRFNFYQKNVWPRFESFLGHTKTYFRKNCSWSCYSRRAWYMTRLMHSNQNWQHPRKQKNLPKLNR